MYPHTMSNTNNLATSSRLRTPSRRRRGSQLLGGGGGASVNSSNSWSFASNNNNANANNHNSNTGDAKSTKSGDSGGDRKTTSSLSSLSSMFDDEEMWAEFKSELEANQIKTGAGIQGMLSKFMADKRRQQQKEEEEERAAQLLKGKEDEDEGGIPHTLRLPAAARRKSSYGSSLIFGKIQSSLSLHSMAGNGKDTTTNDNTASNDLWTVDNSNKESYQEVIRGDAASVCPDAAFELEQQLEREEEILREKTNARESAANNNNGYCGTDRANDKSNLLGMLFGGGGGIGGGGAASMMLSRNNNNNGAGNSGITMPSKNTNLRGMMISDNSGKNTNLRGSSDSGYDTARSNGTGNYNLHDISNSKHSKSHRDIGERERSSRRIGRQESELSKSDNGPSVHLGRRGGGSRVGDSPSNHPDDGRLSKSLTSVGNESESKNKIENKDNNEQVVANVLPRNGLFKDWFGLGGERGAGKKNNTNNDPPKQLSKLKKSGSNRKVDDTTDDAPTDSSAPSLDNNNNDHPPMSGPAPPSRQQQHSEESSSPRNRSRRGIREPRSAQDPISPNNSAPAPTRQRSKPSCLKAAPSGEDPSSNSQPGTTTTNVSPASSVGNVGNVGTGGTGTGTGEQQDQGTVDLLRLLLSLDNPSEERAAGNLRPSVSDGSVVESRRRSQQREQQHQQQHQQQQSQQQQSSHNDQGRGGDRERLEEEKKEDANKRQPQQAQQQAPPPPLNLSKSADSLSAANCNSSNNNNNPSFKYKPRRKHATRQESMSSDSVKASLISTGSSVDIGKRRIPRIEKDSDDNGNHQDGADGINNGAENDNGNGNGNGNDSRQWSAGNVSTRTSATSGNSGDSKENNALKRQVNSMMSTGSLRDMKKRHIPVCAIPNKGWNASGGNGNSGALLASDNGGNGNGASLSDHLTRPQPQSGSGNGNAEASGAPVGNSISRAHISLNSMISTGSTKDMRKRHIPTFSIEGVNNNHNQDDWGSGGGNGANNTNNARANSTNSLMDQQQQRQPMQQQQQEGQGRNDSFSRQVAYMASTGSMRDVQKRHVPSMGERHNQDWANNGNNNNSNNNIMAGNNHQSNSLSRPGGGTALNIGVGGSALNLRQGLNRPSGNALNHLQGGLSRPSDNALNRQGVSRPSDNALNSQVANMVSTGSLRDLKKRHVPTTGERKNQGWAFENNKGNNDNNREGGATLDRDNREAFENNNENNNGGNSIDPSIVSGNDPMVNVAGCSIDLRRRQVKSSIAVHRNNVMVDGKQSMLGESAFKKLETFSSMSSELARPKPQGHANSSMAFLNSNGRGATASNHQAQEIHQSSNNHSNSHNTRGVNNAGCTDLFRRYLETKSTGISNNGMGSRAITPFGSHDCTDEVSPATSAAVGELLVDWGDPTEEDDEPSYPEIIQEPRARKIQQVAPAPAIVWPGFSSIVEDRTITITAQRRVSDLTTAFDSDEDSEGNPEEEPAPVAFRRKMRSLSIVEAPEEEEEEDEEEEVEPVPLVFLSTPRDNNPPLPSHLQTHNENPGYLSQHPSKDRDDGYNYNDETNHANDEGGDFCFYTGHDDDEDDRSPSRDNGVLQLEDEPERSNMRERAMSFTMGETLIRNMSKETLHEELLDDLESLESEDDQNEK